MANIRSIGGNPIVPDQISESFGGVMPKLLAGAAQALTGSDETLATWMQRTSERDGVAEVKSIHGNTVVWNQCVDSDTSIVTIPSGHKYLGVIGGSASIATSDGTAVSVTGGTDQLFDLTLMFGAGNEPATVAEFEAMYPLPYYPYSAPTLKPVSITGIRSEDSDGNTLTERAIPVSTYFPTGLKSAGSVYDELTESAAVTRVGAVDLGTLEWTMTNAGKFRTTKKSILLWSTLVCTKYESYAGVLADMPDKSISATNSQTALLLRVYDSAYTDVVTFKAAMSGVMLHYALATPTTTPIDPPLNLSYKVSDFGTERVMHTDPTAAPTLVVTYGSTADGIRDRALACIAPVENGRASANYGVGTYLIHGGQLCRVTTAIATGEAIAIGTNVVATTVMAEVIALTS